jgi:Leucine-rich repeat (LRR) protein
MMITVKYPTPTASFAEQQDTFVSSFEQINGNVVYIDCCGNGLTSLPENFGDLFPNLIHFDCSQNELSRLPLSLLKCTKLEHINYDKHKIEQIPLQLLLFINRINNPREPPRIEFNFKKGISQG